MWRSVAVPSEHRGWGLTLESGDRRVPFVRTRIVRLRHGAADVRGADLAQGTAAACAALAVAVEPPVWLGFGGVVGLSLLQVVWLRRPAVPAKVLGMRQMILGLALVALTAVGVALS